MVSSTVLVNGSSTLNGANVSAGATVNISLQDSAGVTDWVCIAISTDELNTINAVNATVSISQLTFSGTYTQPSTATGSVVIFQSTVNQDPTTATTFGVFVLDPLGTRLFAPGETSESSAQYGVVADLNALGRSSLSVPLATTSTPGIVQLVGDISGTYNDVVVTGIQGNPVKSGTLGATQDGYVATWVNADSKIEFKSLGSITVDEATTTSVGTVQLAGDLGGNGTVATAPTVKNVTGDSSRNVTISASTGITTIAGGIDGYVNIIGNASYTVDTGVKDFVILTAVASSSKTVTLPAHVKGRVLIIKDTAGNLTSTINLILARNGGTGNIEGVAASYNIGVPGFTITLVSDGSNWDIIS